MKKKDSNLTFTMIVVFVVVTVVWLVSFFILSSLFGSPSGSGTAGDLFGAVGALFSGWAFVGVLWAILLQRKSLQLQHDDLKATLEEMKQAREAHEETAENLRKQSETIKIQTRVDILRTLIETPLQIDANRFLDRYAQDISTERAALADNVKELSKILNSLQEKP